MTAHRRRAQIDALLREEKKLQDRIARAVCKLQSECEHPVAARRETPYKEGYFHDTSPPLRVCNICGLSEEGWTFKKLQGYEELPQITRDQLYELRLMQCEKEDEDDRNDL